MIISKNEQIQELQCVLEMNEEKVKELESLQECKSNLLAKLQNYIHIYFYQ